MRHQPSSQPHSWQRYSTMMSLTNGAAGSTTSCGLTHRDGRSRMRGRTLGTLHARLQECSETAHTWARTKALPCIPRLEGFRSFKLLDWAAPTTMKVRSLVTTRWSARDHTAIPRYEVRRGAGNRNTPPQKDAGRLYKRVERRHLQSARRRFQSVATRHVRNSTLQYYHRFRLASLIGCK